MKRTLLFLLIASSVSANAQKIESIHVDLYTDSLKKVTFNYINIDGKLANGKYLPLDNNDLTFWCSDGRFEGNNLWVDPDFAKPKVDIKVTLKSNPALQKEFSIYIKTAPDPELKTQDDMINEMKSKGKKNKKN